MKSLKHVFTLAMTAALLGAFAFSAAPAHAKGKTGLSPVQIQSVINKNKGKIKNCAKSQNSKKLKGRMMLAFKIKANGKVANASVAPMSKKFSGTDVGKCVARAVKGMSFPKAQKATTVSVFPVDINP